MIGGGLILWNAIIICEMSKTSWQTGKTPNERRLGESFQDMLCSRVEFGKKIFWLLRLKNWNVGGIRNVSQKTECERSPDNPKRWRICISCGGRFSKIIRNRLRIPRTDSETGFHREERISAENLKAIGKSFYLKSKKTTQKLGKIFGLFNDTSFIVTTLNPEFNLRAKRRNHSLFPRFKLLNETPPKRNVRCGWRTGEKPKTSEAKNKFNCIDIAVKDGILYFITTLRTNSFRWKDPKEALHLIPFEGESKHMLSRLAAQRICETKLFK